MMRVVCKECDWMGNETDLLIGTNPFEDYRIYGCPKCRSIDSTYITCDEPGCRNPVTCGTPTPNGYRSTCGKHAPLPLVGKKK